MIICSTLTFATSSFYVDREGWCRGLEIPFTVYNLSEWNDREDILDDDDENFSKLKLRESRIYELTKFKSFRLKTRDIRRYIAMRPDVKIFVMLRFNTQSQSAWDKLKAFHLWF